MKTAPPTKVLRLTSTLSLGVEVAWTDQGAIVCLRYYDRLPAAVTTQAKDEGYTVDDHTTSTGA